MSTKITSPVKNLGKSTSSFGPHTITFEDGVATVDFELSDGLLAYLVGAGYGIDGAPPTTTPDPVPLDPRALPVVEQVGTELRDAAVDPAAGDFLPPLNAGDANPHGPDVVAPGVHGVQDVRPVKAGPVGTPAQQNTRESDHASAATDGTPVATTSEELATAAATGDTVALAQADPQELKGEALQQALRAAGLPTTGSADEKRQRLQEHQDVV